MGKLASSGIARMREWRPCCRPDSTPKLISQAKQPGGLKHHCATARSADGSRSASDPASRLPVLARRSRSGCGKSIYHNTNTNKRLLWNAYRHTSPLPGRGNPGSQAFAAPGCSVDSRRQTPGAGLGAEGGRGAAFQRRGSNNSQQPPTGSTTRLLPAEKPGDAFRTGYREDTPGWKA